MPEADDDPCRASDPLRCECPFNGVLVNTDHMTALYPKSGTFKVGRALYSARQFTRLGRHFWEIFVYGQESQPKVKAMPAYGNYVVSAWMQHMGMAFIIDPTVLGVRPVVHVWRIQRALRKGWLARRREQRTLALMMAWHPRLGSSSLLPCLPYDLLRCKILVE